jgi:hypothetical protein
MENIMLTKNTAAFIAEALRHVDMDLVRRGYYSKNEQGQACFIGCHAGGNNPLWLEENYGFPQMLTRICESVFERLPDGADTAFHAAIPVAVDRNGKDLTRVAWAFLAAELRYLPVQSAHIQAAINPVIAGMDLKAQGLDWPAAAAAAADAAARAAADAATLRQRDTILRLISEAV